MTRIRVTDLNFGKIWLFRSFLVKIVIVCHFTKNPFFKYEILKDGKHILFDCVVKLNADSEFLVHFRVPMTYNTSFISVKNTLTQHINVCAQIKALLMGIY